MARDLTAGSRFCGVPNFLFFLNNLSDYHVKSNTRCVEKSLNSLAIAVKLFTSNVCEVCLTLIHWCFVFIIFIDHITIKWIEKKTIHSSVMKDLFNLMHFDGTKKSCKNCLGIYPSWRKICFLQDLARFLQKSSILARFLDVMAFLQDSWMQWHLLKNLERFLQETVLYHDSGKILQEIIFLCTHYVLMIYAYH